MRKMLRWRRCSGRALLLVCSYCNTPRRHVYGWEWNSVSGWSNRVRSINWRCRLCARLRYSSEGGYLRPTGLGRMGRLGVMLRAYGNLLRPKSWFPAFSPPLKNRRKLASANCHPSVGTGSGDTFKAMVHRTPESHARKGLAWQQAQKE